MNAGVTTNGTVFGLCVVIFMVSLGFKSTKGPDGVFASS